MDGEALDLSLGNRRDNQDSDVDLETIGEVPFPGCLNNDSGICADSEPQGQPSGPGPEEHFTIEMSSRKLQAKCERLDVTVLSNIGEHYTLGDKNFGPPSKPNVHVTAEQLRPMTISVPIRTKEEAFSSKLHELCLRHPIVVIRGMNSVLNMDLELFSTKSFVHVDPDHPLEVRSQLRNATNKNLDANGNPVWQVYSQRTFTTIAKYAVYQCQSFLESSLKTCTNAGVESVDANLDQPQGETTKIRSSKPTKYIQFGTNLDLSDNAKWKLQLQQLDKLPSWLKVADPDNMLSHVGHVIMGMNTVQAYLKVPGCRTPGHQENNNFGGVNINIGPEDCEWFAVPHEYWGCVLRLCEMNFLSYLNGSWWPNLQDLYDEGCPVYRFVQRPGELVWINSGCVHWVQSLGHCNNVAWNVGPLSSRQYRLAIERYEFNKGRMYQSLVPMINLSWNLARELIVTDAELFTLIKTVLMKALVQCMKSLQLLKMKDVEVTLYPRKKKDPARYCGQCKEEIFNILLIREQEKRRSVYCIDCARQSKWDLGGFLCLQEFPLEDLFDVYDSFVLHSEGW